MSKPVHQPVDLLLESNLRPSSAVARPMTLLDAPKVDPETQPASFNWMPIFTGIVAMLALFVAVAYL